MKTTAMVSRFLGSHPIKRPILSFESQSRLQNYNHHLNEMIIGNNKIGNQRHDWLVI